MANPNLTLHEWDIVFSLIEHELERTDDASRTKELDRIRTKIEESTTI